MPLPTRVQSIVDDSCSHLNQLFTFGHGKLTSVQFLLFHRINFGDCLFIWFWSCGQCWLVTYGGLVMTLESGINEGRRYGGDTQAPTYDGTRHQQMRQAT